MQGAYIYVKRTACTWLWLVGPIMACVLTSATIVCGLRRESSRLVAVSSRAQKGGEKAQVRR